MMGSMDRGGSGARAARGAGGVAGLTLIEMIMVILVLGILFSLTTITVTGLTPVYRVRSASRTLGARIEELRAIAISTGRPLGIRYTLLDDQNYYQMIPPASEEYPDQPIEDRKLGLKTDLPAGVRFRRITFPGGRSLERGAVNVVFSPMGNTGSHVATIEGKAKESSSILLSVKFNAITATIDFAEGEAGFETHES